MTINFLSATFESNKGEFGWSIQKVVITMLTLLDIAIGLPILIIKEDARLRHERIQFYLAVFAAFRNKTLRNRLGLVDDPFATLPLGIDQIYTEGVTIHVN